MTMAIALTTGHPYVPVGGELSGAGQRCAVIAVPSRSAVSLNGRQADMTAYTVGGSNYVGLRDAGRAMDFGVTWDGAAKVIRIDTGAGYGT